MSCPNCAAQASMHRTNCIYCGSSLSIGREPTPIERRLTSQEFRLERLTERTQARQRHDPDVINSRVLSAIQTQLKPLAEFTHTDLVQHTNLNPCAIMHALHRLVEKRIVAKVGKVKIRSNRSHDLWQVLIQAKDVASRSKRRATAPLAAPTEHR